MRRPKRWAAFGLSVWMTLSLAISGCGVRETEGVREEMGQTGQTQAAGGNQSVGSDGSAAGEEEQIPVVPSFEIV